MSVRKPERHLFHGSLCARDGISPADSVTSDSFPQPNLLTGGKLFQRIFGTNDPFRPNLRGYEVQAASQLAARNDGARNNTGTSDLPLRAASSKPVVPAVIGFNYIEAGQILKRSGYTVKYYRGQPAANEKLKFRVAQQEPSPRAPLKKGQLVKLTLYTDPITQTAGDSPASPTPVQTATVPAVTGLSWTAAEKSLTSQNLQVKFRRGRKATRETDVFRVYEQTPRGGAPAPADGTVILTLYAKPDTPQPASASPAGQ